ncbi:uncharacterized protein LOC112056194 isoform X2 [Bicyclus anynana]|uniref:Uncharacterized protein LOC112056194 isoform X2 n=1 Tax=Bicyclus anynana TaxID=110368 RepID=A0ABM3LVN7_BICAN|nr:uncharacterized protein LOC112056194 isoform X2 [Bicyclus anynana]
MLEDSRDGRSLVEGGDPYDLHVMTGSAEAVEAEGLESNLPLPGDMSDEDIILRIAMLDMAHSARIRRQYRSVLKCRVLLKRISLWNDMNLHRKILN